MLAEYSGVSAIKGSDRLGDKLNTKLNLKVVTKDLPSVPGVMDSPNLSPNVSAREIIEQAKYETHMKTLMQEPKSNKEKLQPINLSFKDQEFDSSKGIKTTSKS